MSAEHWRKLCLPFFAVLAVLSSILVASPISHAATSEVQSAEAAFNAQFNTLERQALAIQHEPAVQSTLPMPISMDSEPIVSRPEIVPTNPKLLGVGLTYGETILQPNCYQPPASLVQHPLKLTPAELVKYGLFAPDQFSSLSAWEYNVEHELHRSCLATVVPGVKEAPAKTAAPTKPKIPLDTCSTVGNPYTTSNWAGYMQCPAGSTYEVESAMLDYVPTFVNPDPDIPCDGTLDYTFFNVSAWSGLGGVDGGLAQAGLYHWAKDNVCPTRGFQEEVRDGFVENLHNDSSCPDYYSPYGTGVVAITFSPYIATGDEMQAITINNYDGTDGPGMETNDLTGGYYSGYYNYGCDPATDTSECINEETGAKGYTQAYVPDTTANIDDHACQTKNNAGTWDYMGTSGYSMDKVIDFQMGLGTPLQPAGSPGTNGEFYVEVNNGI